MSSNLPDYLEDAYPLSALQAGMLFHSVAKPASGVYIEQICVDVSGKDFDSEVFKRSWDFLIARHAVLRTSFSWRKLKKPVQLVHRTASLNWEEHDWTSFSETEQKNLLDAFKKSDRRRDFDLEQAPVARMTLVKNPDGRILWIWTRHHIIADGWSTSQLLAELQEVYGSLKANKLPAEPSAPLYRNYIAWLLNQDQALEKEFWQRYLDGVSSKTSLLPGRSGYKAVYEEQDLLAGQCSVRLPEPLTQALSTISRECRVTLNVAVQAAWCILLNRYTGSTDIVWGCTFSGRPPNLPDINELVGLCINTVPIRQSIDDSQSLEHFLQTLQNNQLEVMSHETTALPDIQKWSGLDGGENLFDSLVVFENYPRTSKGNGDNALDFLNIEYNEQSNVPVALIAVPGERLELICVFDKARYTTTQCKRLLSQMVCLILSMTSGRLTPVGELDILPESEKKQLQLFSRPESDSPGEADQPVSIDQVILAHANKRPEDVALVCGTSQLTYRQLADQSMIYAIAIGYALQDLNVQSNGRDPFQRIVALHLDRGVNAIVLMISVLRAGACYVVLDPAYPDEKLQQMLEDSDASLLVTESDSLDMAGCLRRSVGELAECSIADDSIDRNSGGVASSRERSVSDLAYLLYTSGSTGKPKGVKITHANLIASTQARNSFYIHSPSCFLLLSSLSFDSSVAGIYWTLTTGNRLVVSEPRSEQDMQGLAKLISQQRVTHTLCLPGLYRLLLEAVESRHSQQLLMSLKTVVVAGESLIAPGVVDRHRELLPKTQLVNEYGPTEATVWCCAYDATNHDADLPVPIGRPVNNTSLFILDRNHRLAPQGAQGELAIGGSNVSPGYWNDRDKTGNSFRQIRVFDGSEERLYLTGDQARWLDDGNLEYLGRSDRQIKIRGHRIEPGEVESHLLGDNAVKNAAVVVYQSPQTASGSNVLRLVACVIPVSGDFDISQLNLRMKSRLPEHMVPGVFELMSEFPQLGNGKLDREKLVNVVRTRMQNRVDRAEAKSAPESDAEKVLWQVWTEVLGQSDFGIDDHFFQIGGDSIASISVVSRVANQGLNLSPHDLFEAPTVRECARRMQFSAQHSAIYAPELIKSELSNLKSQFGDKATYRYKLSDAQSGFLFAHANGDALDPGHMQIQVRLSGSMCTDQFLDALYIVVKKHEALRTAIFWRSVETPSQVVFEAGKPLCEFSMLSESTASGVIKQYLLEDKNNKLDLECAQSWRMTLFRVSDEEHILCWSCHHSLVDGWSAALVIKDLVAIYQSQTPEGEDETPLVQFKDYCYWLERIDFSKPQRAWRKLAADKKLMNLGGKPLPKTANDKYDNVSLTLAPEAYKHLTVTLQTTGTTVSQLVHSYWGAVLACVSSTRHFGFYSTVSGRNIPFAGAGEVVGQLVNHLPVLLERDPSENLGAYIHNFEQRYALLARSEHVSPSQFLNWCGPNVHTIVKERDKMALPSLVMVENFPWNDHSVASDGQLVVTSFQRRGRNEYFVEGAASSSFPLTHVAIQEKDCLQLQLHFDSGLFERDAASSLLKQIEKIIEFWSRDLVGTIDQGFINAAEKFFQSKAWTAPHSGQRLGIESRPPYTGIEHSLVKIWRQVFNKNLNNVMQNFFDFGGNSIMAVQIVESVRKELGMKMSLAALFEHNTVEKLAVHLKDQVSESFETVVRIQGEGENRPVFGIHAEGNVLFYRDLAQSLGNGQPFYGLQTPELSGGTKMFSSIPEMAGQYIDEIKKFQPEGPYTIVGMCFGGWIAFEMAQQLAAQGDIVQPLVILDSEGPSVRNQETIPGAVVTKSAPLHQGTISPARNKTTGRAEVSGLRDWWREKTTYSRQAPLWVKAIEHYKTGRLKELAYKYIVSTPIFYRRTRLSRVVDVQETTRELFDRIKLNQQFLKRLYKPKTYSGNMVFIRSEQYEERTDKNHHIPQWQKVCEGEVIDYLISGRHTNMMELPHVHRVADIIIDHRNVEKDPSEHIQE